MNKRRTRKNRGGGKDPLEENRKAMGFDREKTRNI